MSKIICDCTKVAPASIFRRRSRNSRSTCSAKGLTTAPTASGFGALHGDALAISCVAPSVAHTFDGAGHRIALYAEDRLSAERCRAHNLGLQGEPAAISGRKRGRLSLRPLLPRERHRGQRRHPRLAGVIVGQPDNIDGVGQNSDPVADTRAIGLGRQRDLRGRQGPQRHDR